MARRKTATHQILASEYLERYPSEAAELLESAPAGEVGRLLAAAPEARAVRVLDSLTPDTAVRALEHMEEAHAAHLLGGLDSAQAVPLLIRMEEESRERLLEHLARPVARELRELMSYPPDTAGRMMDPRVTAIRPDMTAGEALRRLRVLMKQRPLQDVFLVDEEGRLAGYVDLQEVALAHPETKLENLTRRQAPAVQAMAPGEEVVETAERFQRPALPVVDIEDRLVGIILYERLVAAAAEEATADMQTMVGASRDERALSPPWFAVRKRLPWLEINLATAFLASAVVGLFEGLIAKVTALAVLLPVVAGQSGNTGQQALAVTMRGLALREIRVRHWLRVSLKETGVAFINGVAVAVTTSAVVYLWSRSSGLALIIGISMVLSMVAAGLAGAAIPILLTAFGQDPAQSSSIILTTITDVTGFFSFLGIATLLLNML